mgnify:CR=1 FL=1
MVCEYQVLYHELHEPIQPKEVYGIKGFFMHLFIYLLAATSIIPQYMVVYTSFRAAKMQVFVDGFSLESYRKVFSTAIQSIKNTYLYCLAAIVIIVVLGHAHCLPGGAA